MTLDYGTIIKLDTDDWDFMGKEFKVIKATPRENSTAVKLVVEDLATLEIISFVVPKQQIYQEGPQWIG